MKKVAFIGIDTPIFLGILKNEIQIMSMQVMKLLSVRNGNKKPFPLHVVYKEWGMGLPFLRVKISTKLSPPQKKPFFCYPQYHTIIVTIPFLISIPIPFPFHELNQSCVK